MTQSTSQPYGIRTIVDFATRSVDQYLVIGPRAVNPFWIQASRLPQLLTLANDDVAVMDSVHESEIKKFKEVYRDGDVFVFFTDKELSGALPLAELLFFINAYEEGPRNAALADADRKSDVRKRVAALGGSGAAKSATSSPATPPARS